MKLTPSTTFTALAKGSAKETVWRVFVRKVTSLSDALSTGTWTEITSRIDIDNFGNLLLDENFDGVGSPEPTFTIAVASPAGYGPTLANQGELSWRFGLLFAAANLTLLATSTNNQLQFTIAGVPGFDYAVQTSTNLLDWVNLATNAAPFDFTDTITDAYPQRFYRAVYRP